MGIEMDVDTNFSDIEIDTDTDTDTDEPDSDADINTDTDVDIDTYIRPAKKWEGHRATQWIRGKWHHQEGGKSSTPQMEGTHTAPRRGGNTPRQKGKETSGRFV